MAREIERKFLLTDDRWRAHVTRSREVAQGYLAVTARGSVRIRRSGDLGYLTVKGKRGPDGRDEFEYPIPLADAEFMLKTLCETAIIHKSRHDVHVGSLHIEVDEFHEGNTGLVLAEIELEHPEALPDNLPEWLGADVTDDERYYNAHLSRAPFGSWRSLPSAFPGSPVRTHEGEADQGPLPSDHGPLHHRGHRAHDGYRRPTTTR